MITTMSSSRHRFIIALDFDGTLFEHSDTEPFPAVGAPITPVIERAIEIQRAGADLILWTCRHADALIPALAACRKSGILLSAVNENISWAVTQLNGPKIFANLYVDDRAPGSIQAFLKGDF